MNKIQGVIKRDYQFINFKQHYKSLQKAKSQLLKYKTQSKQTSQIYESKLISLSNNKEQKKSKKIQICLSVIIAILTTLWVQITVQRHAPFIRTAQCYFNQQILEHDSQDIYQGSDVIYWRNGRSYNFEEITNLFTNFYSVIQNLQIDSLFQLHPKSYSQILQNQNDIQILAQYRFDKYGFQTVFITYQQKIIDIKKLIQSTMLNRTFYQFLWKFDILVNIPIIYRSQTALMKLNFNGQIFSSFQIQYILQVDIQDDNENLIRLGKQDNNNIKIRKKHQAHNLDLSIPYINWIILGIFTILLFMQLKYVLIKNKIIQIQLSNQLQQQFKIQKILQQKYNNYPINNSSNQSKQENKIKPAKLDQQQQYFQSLNQRINKIGKYQVIQLIITFIAILGYYNNHNGLICLFSWTKIIVYLSQLKNRLMFGFLFQQAFPLILNILFNIFLVITAFVLFNMIVITSTYKFQAIQLGYFQYLFNYFQYGIYQNFIFAFQPYGLLTSFFYFLQLLFLLGVGNNIFMSILASQVLKNSYINSVQQMLNDLKVDCPACGARKNLKNQFKQKKGALISKIVGEYNLDQRKEGDPSEQYNIIVKSPLISPYFPKKYQQQKQQQPFLSPKLKKLNKKLKQQNNIQQKSLSESQKKLKQLQNKVKLNSKKKINVEITSSNIDENKLNYIQIKNKFMLLYDKIQKFKQIQKNKFTNNHMLLYQDYIKRKIQILTKIKTKCQVVQKKNGLKLQK